MEHARKMILVDPNVLEKTQQIQNTQPKTLSVLDGEMMDILNNKTIDDREKWIMYNQVLQRYLNIINENRKPFSFSTIEESKQKALEKEEEKDQDFNFIINSIPKTLRSKASLLLEEITKNNYIMWDDRGVVSVDGSVIKGSNIADLVDDIIRNRKGSDPPGWELFAEGLRNINVPRLLIGNQKRLEFINEKVADTSEVSGAFDSSVTSTPQQKRRQRKRKTKSAKKRGVKRGTRVWENLSL